MRQERKILNIYGNKFTGPLGGATSYALERARAPALRIRPPARLVRRKAHTRAHDTHCIKLGTDIGANDKDHASTSQTAHTDRSERQQHQQSLRAHRTRASALASPEPCARNPACEYTASSRPSDQHALTGVVVTCAPVGGQHAAHCMAACPPPPRGAVGVRGGAVPRPSTPCCAGTSNCRNECTSHCPASSSPAAAVKYIPAHDA